GTNYLIKQGAKLVSSVEDIIEELNIEPCSQRANTQEKSSLDNIGLNKTEELVYNSLSCQPRHLDEICQNCGKDIKDILAALFRLEMKKTVRQLPGKRFLRN
ncbi:MAG: DNA-protecting protein DprA, partial [Candidatus Omnitrophica bacterium]|nr:DNA-protecting protein DprA [Candidatus Omnitrophota bacterium]